MLVAFPVLVERDIKMVGPFLIVSMFLTFLYIYISLLKNRKTNKNYNQNKIHSLQKLLPLPGLPIMRIILWTIFRNGLSMPHMIVYAGQNHKMALFKFWKLRVAAINDIKLGKELFSNPVFCGKHMTDTFIELSQGQYGLINNDGSKWKAQRRLCFNILKQFGFGPNSMESFISTEVEDLIQNWIDKKGERFSPNKSFYLPVLNAIWVILTGDRASEQDTEGNFVNIIHSVYGGFTGILSIPDAFLMGCKIPMATVKKIIKWVPIFSGIKLWFSSLDELHSYFRNIIATKKKGFNVDGTPTNLVDAYLKEIHNTTDPDSELFGWKGEINLVAAMSDFLLGGGDTTANMLAWSMLHLIRRPDIQEKIQTEIDAGVDRNRRPALNDRASCPYTQAFILEVLRFNPVSAGSLPHVTTEDARIGPYFIEKDTIVVLNILKIQHDPEIWGDPQVFRPERFLSEDGKTVLRHDALCIFSLGPRRCIGEPVARDTLFLFISAICQQFTLTKDPLLKEKWPSLRSHVSIIHSPFTFHMVASERLTGKENLLR